MNTATISQISKSFAISTRALRYYEQLGLLKSTRLDDYAYRAYDEEAVRRLQQIMVLRKLRIPLKQIVTILASEDAAKIIETFRQNLSEIDDEITALSTIRSILSTFIARLNENAHLDINLSLFDDSAVCGFVDSLALSKNNFREEKPMKELNMASERLSKLKDVRIVYLPPATVAASHYVGDEPEMHAGMVLDAFVRDSGLVGIKPDLRHLGFNHPNPVDESNNHGYEMWVTIPNDMEVPATLTKKRFPGGLYAAHMIKMGDFQEWEWLIQWVFASDKYTYNGELDANGNLTDGEHMHGLLEEHLNYINHVSLQNTEPEDMQLDLLVPIKEKA
jgi:DNA-binding transcriptional MerR regulator/DNA gyrase inhibitor GyrI